MTITGAVVLGCFYFRVEIARAGFDPRMEMTSCCFDLRMEIARAVFDLRMQIASRYFDLRMEMAKAGGLDLNLRMEIQCNSCSLRLL